MRASLRSLAALVALTAPLSNAVSLDVTDPDSIRNAASIIAYGTVKYYTGNITNTPETLGVLDAPYYWWEAGALWGAMLDYYHFTGDSTYNDVTTQALISQVGPNNDYMVPFQKLDEGNDDQAFWGFATMAAAERSFPNPTGGVPTWLQLTENLWNTQVRRWDTTTCGGGLKWQIYSTNFGYDYKNTVSNGAFFQLSARLARFTGNQTYADWAEKVMAWSMDSGLVNSIYQVWDGAQDTENCANPTTDAWTYNTGIYLYGAAVMYNYTNGASLWETHTTGLMKATDYFFSPFSNSTNVMFEPACEPYYRCNNDEYSFKAYLSRFMWASTLMAPFLTSQVTTRLQASSMAAAASCSGPSDGVTCGEHWYFNGYDGIYGIGQELSALETIQGLLTPGSAPPQVHLEQAPQISAPTVSTTSSSDPPSTSSVVPTTSSSTSTSSSVVPTITSSSTPPSTTPTSTSSQIALPGSTSTSSSPPTTSSPSSTSSTSSSSHTSFSSIAFTSSSTSSSGISSPPSHTSLASIVTSHRTSSSGPPPSTHTSSPVTSATTATTTTRSAAGQLQGPLAWLSVIAVGAVMMNIS